MTIEDIVTVNVTATASQISLAGFGTPMVLAPLAEIPAGFTERIRFFTTEQEMLDLGFITSDQTLIEARAFFNQNPRVPRVAVGRRIAAVAQVTNVDLGGAAPDGTYEITINSTVFSFVASSSTVNAIITALHTAINLGSEPVTSTDNTGDLDLTADVAGIPFTVSTSAPVPADFTVAVTTPSVGIPEDLSAISDENDDWYALHLTIRDAANILTTAAAIQPLTKFFHAQSSDADIITAVSTDVMSQLQALNFSRTMLTFEKVDATPTASAWSGTKLHEVAGQTTWAFSTLVGVVATTLTTTERANLQGKNGNYYQNFDGLPDLTQFGKMASTTGLLFADEVRGLDQLVQRIEVETLLILNKRPAYTQGGINQVSAGTTTALIQSTNDGFIAASRVNAVTGDTETPAFTVTPPLIQDISSTDRINRLLPPSNPIRFEATLGGGVHKATIVGTVSAA